MGAVTACGWGLDALRDGLFAGQPAFRSIRTFDSAGHRTHLAGEVPGQPPPGSPAAWRRAARADRYALHAAAEAWRAAGLSRDAGRAGVYFGSSTGGMLEGERWFMERSRHARRRAGLSMLVSHALGAPAEAVARELGVTGPVETVASACASGALAIESALRDVRSGDVDVALAGGSDALCQLTHGGFNSLRAVDAEPCRPFRADRAGLTLGEGAAALVLEREDRARSRGARILGELLGAGSTCDATHMTAPHPEGRGAASALRAALCDAGAVPDDVDFVNAHGTGTPLNDAAEWQALAQVFGERAARLPVAATKAIVGHVLGAAGAVEAVATLCCLEAGRVHPVPGQGPRDPAAAADLVTDRARELQRSLVAVSLSLAFGGANAALVLGRAPA